MRMTENSPKNAKENYLKIRKTALKKIATAKKVWSDSCIADLNNVKTLKEAVSAFKEAPWATQAKQKALEKVAELCSTIEQLSKLSNCLARKRFKDFEDNPLLQKWEYLSRIDVHLATTLEEIKEVYWNCPYSGYYRRSEDIAGKESAISRAFNKWVQLCTSAEDMNTLSRATAQKHYYKSDVVSKRMGELDLYCRIYF